MSVSALFVFAQIGAAAAAGLPDSGHRVTSPRGAADTAPVMAVADSAVPLPQADSLFGRSGKLRARFLSTMRHSLELPVLRHFFGDSA